jgi:complement component 1 Q subcomponent-binding protein
MVIYSVVPENMTEFIVRIVKKGGKSGLLIDASSIDTSFEFNSIQYSEDVNSLHNDYINQRSVDNYTGPAFNTLDDRLQTEFTEFFNSLGINEELMSFINVLSVDKDQRLYLTWLKNVNKFFNH